MSIANNRTQSHQSRITQCSRMLKERQTAVYLLRCTKIRPRNPRIHWNPPRTSRHPDHHSQTPNQTVKKKDLSCRNPRQKSIHRYRFSYRGIPKSKSQNFNRENTAWWRPLCHHYCCCICTHLWKKRDKPQHQRKILWPIKQSYIWSSVKWIRLVHFTLISQ